MSYEAQFGQSRSSVDEKYIVVVVVSEKVWLVVVWIVLAKPKKGGRK